MELFGAMLPVPAKSTGYLVYRGGPRKSQVPGTIIHMWNRVLSEPKAVMGAAEAKPTLRLSVGIERRARRAPPTCWLPTRHVQGLATCERRRPAQSRSILSHTSCQSFLPQPSSTAAALTPLLAAICSLGMARICAFLFLTLYLVSFPGYTLYTLLHMSPCYCIHLSTAY